MKSAAIQELPIQKIEEWEWSPYCRFPSPPLLPSPNVKHNLRLRNLQKLSLQMNISNIDEIMGFSNFSSYASNINFGFQPYKRPKSDFLQQKEGEGRRIEILKLLL